MATPRKTPSGKWRINVFMGYGEDGKRINRQDILETYQEAVQLIALLKLERKTIKKRGLTVQMALNKFIGSIDTILSPSTVAGYRQLARNAFESIANIRIENLTEADVQACINQYAQTHSPKTVRNAYGFLRRALKSYGHSSINGVSLPAKKKPNIAVPSDEEVKKCMELAEHPGMRQAILLAAGVGMRRGEIAALEWQHINYADSTVTVSQTYVKASDGKLYLKPPKTALSERTILVGDNIMQGFKALAFVPGPHPINLTPDAITRRFQRICSKAGFKFRFHDLRHYQASIMLAEEIPDKYAMERMGHSSSNMLRNVYQHTISEEQRRFSAKLNARIAERLSTSNVSISTSPE